MKAFWCILFFGWFQVAFSQISGTVVDHESGEPLPYVHIGVENKNLGTISKEDGSFSFDVNRMEDRELLTFSMLGYDRVSISKASLKDDLVVKMRKKTVYLKGVKISAKRLKSKPIILGASPSKTTTGQSGYKEYGMGGEWAVLLDPKGQQLVVEKIKFHTRFNTVDSVLFRLNLYSIKDGVPDTSLLKSTAFVTSYSGDRWISGDISDQSIRINTPVVASMELVRIWFGETTDNQLFYTHSQDQRAKYFSRQSSLDGWEESSPVPITLVLECFPADKESD